MLFMRTARKHVYRARANVLTSFSGFHANFRERYLAKFLSGEVGAAERYETCR